MLRGAQIEAGHGRLRQACASSNFQAKSALFCFLPTVALKSLCVRIYEQDRKVNLVSLLFYFRLD